MQFHSNTQLTLGADTIMLVYVNGIGSNVIMRLAFCYYRAVINDRLNTGNFEKMSVAMRPGFKFVAVMAALALGSVLLSDNVQDANAQPQPVPKAAASARAKLAPPFPEPPLYLSEAYLKKEQQTEDRLKKVMNICSRC